MADIAKLTASARAIKARSDRALGWPLAVVKAIEGTGVTHKPDVDRIKRLVLSELSKFGDYKPRRLRQRAVR